MIDNHRFSGLPLNKTKIVATIGPASSSRETLERMILAGMDIARLNFSHGEFEDHGVTIRAIRAASAATGKPVAILADMPGPKLRIGMLSDEPITLEPGDTFTLTADGAIGDRTGASVTFPGLARVLRKGNAIYLNDGMIELEVLETTGSEVHCRIVVGGELRSRKGLNLPGLDLGINAFTERDRECLEFALKAGVDAVSQSFVESEEDIVAVRQAASDLGFSPWVIAKIERAGALDKIDGLLKAADGIMIARGDLGVEIPIERIAVIQKDLTHKANLAGKPVITATQMLESMTTSRRPTRAEATDVANAVLDGTDCVMLSEESATGAYPVDAVAMLARISATVEPYRPRFQTREAAEMLRDGGDVSLSDVIAMGVETTAKHISPAAVFVPTRGGTMARSLSRFKLPVWVVAVSPQEATCRRLLFSYGVHPVHEKREPEDWNAYVADWLQSHHVGGGSVIIAEGPSPKHPDANHRIEIVELGRDHERGGKDEDR